MKVKVEFPLRKITEKYYVVHDDTKERFFKRSDPGVVLENGIVRAQIEKSLWDKRKYDYRKSPAKECASREEKVTRKCLFCRKPFKAHRVQYICSPCKYTDAYQTAASNPIF